MKTPIKPMDYYTTISDEIVAFLGKQGIKPLFVDEVHHIKTYHYDSSHKIFDTINVLYSNTNHNTDNSISSSNLNKPPLTGFSTIGEEVVVFLRGYNVSPIYKQKKHGVWVYYYENSQKLFALLGFLYPAVDE